MRAFARNFHRPPFRCRRRCRRCAAVESIAATTTTTTTARCCLYPFAAAAVVPWPLQRSMTSTTSAATLRSEKDCRPPQQSQQQQHQQQREGVGSNYDDVPLVAVRTDISSSGSSSSSSSSSSSRPTIRVHSALQPPPPPPQLLPQNQKQSPPMDYVRGWAWQTVLLQHRLQQKRRMAATATSSSSSSYRHQRDRSDVLLLLEHAPVYTLGRGADETHIAFLQQPPQEQQQQPPASPSNSRTTSSAIHHTYNHGCDQSQELYRQECQTRLSRKGGSARLQTDRHWSHHDSSTNNNNHNNNYCHDDDGEHDDPDSYWEDVCGRVDQVVCHTNVTPVLAPNQVPIYRVERGGEVTFHGPGQLVVYPILDLSSQSTTSNRHAHGGGYYYYKQDLHWFLRQTEQVILNTLAEFGLYRACRDDHHTGVWVDDCKIAAVGVAASRWITTHGFALNVCPDLSYFDTDLILPCGIEGRGVTSLADQNITATVPEVAEVVVKQMQRVFKINIQVGEPLR